MPGSFPPGSKPKTVKDWFGVLNHIDAIAPKSIHFFGAPPKQDILLIRLSNDEMYAVSTKENPTLEEAQQGAEAHHPVFVDEQYTGNEAVAHVEKLIRAFGVKVEV